MPEGRFQPGQKVRIRHTTVQPGQTGKEALSFCSTWHDGEIIEHVKGNVWRTTFGGYGFHALISEEDIDDGQSAQGDGGVQAGQAAQR